MRIRRSGTVSLLCCFNETVKFKPIINVDTEGHLITVGKVRGRKASINELFERMKAGVDLNGCGYVFISHSDSIDDANILADMIRSNLNPKEIIISDIGAVIGAHTGPGALVVCYFGKKEKKDG